MTSVVLRGPTGERATIPAAAITELSIKPEHTAAWDAKVDAAPVVNPHRFLGGAMDVFDGEHGFLLGCEINDTDTASDGTITLEGIDRRAARLTDEEISVSYRDELGVEAIRDVWSRSPVEGFTVHDPPERPVSGEVIQQAQVPADFRGLYEFFSRDESGRFTTDTANTEKVAGGLLPPSSTDADSNTTTIGPSDPFELTSNGVEQLPVNHFLEGEDYADKIGGADVIDVSETAGFQASRASGGQALRFDGVGMWAGWNFTLDYHVPKDCLTVAVRARGRTPQNSALATASVTREPVGISGIANAPDNQTAQRPIFLSENSTFDWRHFESFSPSFKPGDYSVSIVEFPDIENQFDIDAVVVYDSRFASVEGVATPGGPNPLLAFPNNPNDNNELAGPGLYAPSYWFRSAVATTGLKVESATLDVEFSRATDYQLELYAPGADASAEAGDFLSGSSGSVTLDLDPTAVTPRIQAGIRLQPADGGSGPPRLNNQANAIESATLTVDGEAVPVLDEFEEQGTVFDIQKKLHQRCGLVFQYQPGTRTGDLVEWGDGEWGDGAWGGTGGQTTRVESFRRGDPSLVRDLPDGARILDSKRSSSSGDYANRVTVRGADREFSAGRYEATAEDADEIAANGLETIELDRPDLNSFNDVKNRARVELQDRLAADEQGTTATTTPAVVPPGYPYRVPSTLPDATFVEWGDGEWGDGAWGGLGVRTLESSGVTAGQTTELDFQRRGGLAGSDASPLLALLGVGDRGGSR